MGKGVLTVITDKDRARGLLQTSLERLGYRVVGTVELWRRRE
jgi:hypothetical protein